ncbi:hypothetical protein TeGR_g11468, partial [Tetraparma gracilis]
PPSSPPPRLTTSNSHGSFRHALSHIRAAKKAAAAPSPRTNQVKPQFHRAAITTVPPSEARRARAALKAPDAVVLGSLSTPAPGAEHRLLVDGYNVIHKWPRLAKRLKRGDLWDARRMLARELDELARGKGVGVVLVFDGTAQSGARTGKDTAGADRGAEESTGRVEVLYSRPGEEADAVIERMAGEGKGGEARITVCTGDNEIRTAALAAGADTLSPSLLIAELKAQRSSVEAVGKAASDRAAGSR